MLKMKKTLLLTLLLLLTCWAGYAQVKVSGKVVDPDNQPLPGVSILIKGTTEGTVTDIDGKYLIDTKKGATLVFSFIGFTTKEILVGAEKVINVQLDEDVAVLEAVVVVGYGTSTEKEFTGAAANVGGKDLVKLNPTRLENALQGQVAGVNITSSSGSPGGAQNIRIRGFSTNGNNNPLVVVDGVPYSTEGLSALNPDDIESINVLKDATAGIYGVRAANGVIIITTKKGKHGQNPQFSFDAYYGVQETSNKLDLLNATEYAVLKNEAAAANGGTPPFNNVNIGAGTDWQDQVFQTSPIQNYSLSVRGGTDKSTYSIGGSFFDQEGIVGGDKATFTRYNGRVNFTTNISDKLTFTNVLLYTHEKRKTLPENGISSVLFNAINIAPNMTVYDNQGNFTFAEGIGDVINPLAQIANTYNDASANKLVGTLGLEYEVNNHLSIQARAGYNYAIVESKTFSPLVYYGAGKAQNTAMNADLDRFTTEIAPGTSIPVNNSVTEGFSTFFNYNLEAFVNYQRDFDNHKVKGTLGGTLLANRDEGVFATGRNVPFNSYEYADVSATDPTDYLAGSSSFQAESRLQSIFGRAEYSYAQKYLFSVILRRDGSSKFGANNRYGFFPSASAAWVLSDEEFFNVPFIGFAKLRASLGKSGNDRIGNFTYRGLLGGEAVYVFDDQLTRGQAIGKLGNPDLKWETTSQFNTGLDVELLDEALSISLDYYVKTTTDLLFTPDITALLGSYGAGGFPPTINVGKIQNKGLELAFNYNKEIANGVHLSLGYNIATLNNEVLELPEGVNFIENGSFGVGGTSLTRMEVGFPLGYFFGYKTNGVYQNSEEVAAGPTQTGAAAGDLKYQDINGDGVIDFSGDTDKTMIGSPIPDVTMGFNLAVEAKGFDFSANLYASIGNEIVRNYERQTPLANLMAYRIDRWTGEGSSNDPRLTTGPNRNNVFSDFYVEDGSYLRLKNAQLGYTLPNTIAEKIGFSQFRIYAAANNLLTFTKYRGFDPDLGSGSPLLSGVDFGFYPQARTYMLGMNLKF